MKPFGSILVANRGEIACRVLRTARGLGYHTVAIYSDADTEAPHVAMADDSVRIGPAPATESYLDIDRILEAATTTGAEAIHPGYGFLSENAEFARRCSNAGLVFIGPPAEAIGLMGNKARARRHMIEAGVPCVPGYEGTAQDVEAMVAAATEIGFPVMVKAAAGGGGRGMRLVAEPGDLPEALRQARSEAENAFGSGELILEKAIAEPRHVEFQVFADQQGNVLHLGERDCSVQRRHQKVIEEAPCPVMTAALRERMGAAAITAANSIGYVGAGTVEFLLAEAGDFYFLEMNTRLQVEHPVTEGVTGLDLVAIQIAVAQGEALPLTQDDIDLDGHAIEVRLYAEDPEKDFLPATGRIELWQPPEGEGIRVDHGISEGQEISPYYDAMVAKIIANGPTRQAARRRLLRALHETALFGVSTNRDFLLQALEHEIFSAGQATTAFIGKAGLPRAAGKPPFHHAAAAALLDYRARAANALAGSVAVAGPLLNWSSQGSLRSFTELASDGERWRFEVRVSGTAYRISDGDSACTMEVPQDDGRRAEIQIDGTRHHVLYAAHGTGRVWLALEGDSRLFTSPETGDAGAASAAGGGRVLAPMHGQLLELTVAVGEKVRRGQRLLVLEAMKMQHEINSALDGVVVAVHFRPGDQLAADEVVLEIQPEDSGGGAK